MVENFIVQDPRYNYVFCYTDTTMPADSVVKINNVNAPTSRVYTSGNGWNPGVGNSSLGVIGFSYNTNSFVFGGNFQISNSTGVINVSSYAGVVSGLVLNLDAGFSTSYPGSGSTWTDVSGNNNNGTLVNGPIFNSANGGYLTFDGVDDYVGINYNVNLNPATNVSVSVWTRFTVNDSNIRNPIELSASADELYWIFLRADLSPKRWGWGVRQSNNTYAETTSNATNPLINTWYNLTLVANSSTGLVSLYINGALDGSIAYNGTIKQNAAATLSLGRDPGANRRFWKGDIANALVYNTALNAAQIFQNYNSTCGLFGFGAIITRNLQLYLDAGNRSSYPGSGATWSDLSGNSNNGTLVNGPTFNSADGGYLTFDGVDDYVNMGLSTYCNIINISVSAWVFVPTAATGTSYIASRYFNTTGNNGFLLFYDNATSRFGVDGRESSAAYLSLVTTNTYSKGVWYNLTWTKSGSTWTLYVNGALEVSSIRGTGGAAFSNNIMWLGGLDIGGGSKFYSNVRLSVLNIYNRALSQGEITQNFNAFRSRFGL